MRRLSDQHPIVATVVRCGERDQLDAAAGGAFRALHTDSIPAAIRAVREGSVHAVLLSPHAIGASQLPGVAELVRGFPGVNTVALVSGHDSTSGERLLALGSCGVRQMVDLSMREGWRRLRALVVDPASPITARALARVLTALGETTLSCRRFFELVVRQAPRIPTVRKLAAAVGLRPSTLMSRFFRAQVPSPKRYLAMVRLVYAAGYLENPGHSVADVAYRLEYSSPQSFGRHVRTVLGVTGAEFRRRYSLDQALQRFVERLITPYERRLRTFRPLPNGVSDLDRLS
jgi:AraC-like DNA-binding protein